MGHPDLEVLPIDVITAGQICQSVVSSLVLRLGPSRLLTTGGNAAIDADGVSLDVVCIDDVSAASNSAEKANERFTAVGKHLAVHGFPNEEAK